MRAFFLAVMLISAASRAKSYKPNPNKHDAPGTLLINGESTHVVWTDGDSFRIKDGPYKGKGTRLVGYNTLEAFGPVHRWGAWKPQELYELAKASSSVAAAQTWECTTDGKEDGYHRLLINCPALAVEMAKQGHALAYAVDGAADPKVLAAQKEAQAAKRGMWAKGLVNGVVTSVHSADEADTDEEKGSYNRVVDTRTGVAAPRPHHQVYATCQEVCEETDGETSCMVYVPFSHRYRQQPDCLR